jgi:hypothetical protein
MTAMRAEEHLETASKQSVPIEVEMDVEASADEVQAVRAAFSDAGLDATVEAGLERRGADTYPWTIYVTVPIGLLLAGFLYAAGGDAYLAVKRLVAGLYAARRKSSSPQGTVVMMDADSHEWVMLDDDLPDLAWQRLFETEVGKTESGQLRWDPKTESWRDTWEIYKLPPES